MGKRSFAIIGSGALGGLYGAMLARAGFDVHFLFHSDAEHVRQNGLQIDSKNGDFHLDSVNVYDDPEAMPACDVTILALKTTNNHLLRDLLPGPTGTGGTVLVLQNGLNVEVETAAIVGPGRVLGGCCFLCSNKVGKGHIRHLDYGRIVFGRYTPIDAPPPGIDAYTQSLADELQSAGIDAQPTPDLWQARWRKLMWNIPFNGLSVVLDASTKQLIEDEHACHLATDLMQEVANASEATGRPQPDDAIEKTIDHTRHMVPYDSSMRLDYLSGRPMEIEAILGNPIRMAAGAGLKLPKVEMLYHQLHYLQSKKNSDTPQ
ncbi:2-dehydropantoate 2-reductase [Roseimaritima multifibrata]|uniref:2-dehydropantoate 2-reductase n=1 Tax=Roseimaritima multifibrata TaxID=1930274 RepID=A0A517MKA3_9BACT|nr:putative 2-dehydropantoate 2-reductase [Roseimaritima multifibrata]QDS95319.1 2-dehydropantoate 2-reductase [Roseimaritima multifibrata]